MFVRTVYLPEIKHSALARNSHKNLVSCLMAFKSWSKEKSKGAKASYRRISYWRTEAQGYCSGHDWVVQPTGMQVPVTILQEKGNLQPLSCLSGDSAELLEVFVQVSSSFKSRGLKVSSLSINPLVLTNTLNLSHSVNDRARSGTQKSLVWFCHDSYRKNIVPFPERTQAIAATQL